MTQDWLLRIGDAEHFTKSSRFNIWGIDSTVVAGKYFMGNAKPGDRLWFIKSASKGKVVAVATFKQFRKRELGPLFSFTPTNEELGWTSQEGNWDTEVHYTELIQLEDRNLMTEITGNVSIRLYNPDKCKVNLPTEYQTVRPPTPPPTVVQEAQIQGTSPWIAFQERVQLVIHNKYTGAQLMQFASYLKNKKAYTAWTDTEILTEAETFVPPPIIRKKKEKDDDSQGDSENHTKYDNYSGQQLRDRICELLGKPKGLKSTPKFPTKEKLINEIVRLENLNEQLVCPPAQPEPEPTPPPPPSPPPVIQEQPTTPPSDTNPTTNTSSAKKKIPKKVKLDVWNTFIGAEIAKHKCLCCKRTTIDRAEFDCGHVISEANGGGLEISNLRPICSACNNSMSTMNMIDYVKRHGYFIG